MSSVKWIIIFQSKAFENNPSRKCIICQDEGEDWYVDCYDGQNIPKNALSFDSKENAESFMKGYMSCEWALQPIEGCISYVSVKPVVQLQLVGYKATEDLKHESH